MSLSKDPVFIHAWFRSGSTWLWSKLRLEEGICAYYEPLNEELTSWTPERIREGPTKAFEGDHHPPIKQHYFYEYLDLIESRSLKFHPSMSYERYYLLPEERAPELEGYIGQLISFAAAAKKRPALCFCRSQMRALWLRRTFGGIHICQIRGAADQWISFGRHPYFKQRMLLTAFLLNRRHNDCLDFGGGFPAMYDAWQNGQSFRYHDSDALWVFCLLWILSSLQAISASDIILDIDLLGADPAARQSLSRLLQQSNLPHELEDCRPPHSRQDPEVLSAVEETIQRASAWLDARQDFPLLSSVSRGDDIKSKLSWLSATNQSYLSPMLRSTE